MTKIGHYTLGDKLGVGGMGTVYLGTDTRTDTIVAIKELKTEIATPEIIERFRREGEALRDLNHPNIVKMLDMFEHDEKHYLVMEYMSGGDLSDLIKQGAIPVEKCVDMAIDLADALTRAHRLDIIHRDLKPANVLIGDDGVLRLTDFGVAHVGSKDRVTDTDAIVGTIDYLPPEAFDGIFDARGDIWAFGVMLFEMLSGERPFSGSTIYETLQAITTAPIPDLEALCSSAPVSLVDLVYRMLERDIQTRIPSVRRIGSELEDIQHGRESINTPQPARFETDIPDFTLLPKHNLPAQATPFVGREHELDELEELVKSPSIRLITIVAQGGMGKTRLSLELAQRSIDATLFDDGVYFVELAPLSDADSIPNAIGDACGFQFLGEGTPKEQLLSILSQRNILLVLDNYEHLPDGFGLVSDILKSAPDVQIVVTSRQAVSQAGEALFYLSGMDFPDFESPDDAFDYAAVKLFMNSAKRAQPSFELTDETLDYVSRICKLVQGMPLGIVLAASWLTILNISEIADEIQGGLDFLETDETALPERQRSIRAVMDYSWEQMTETEQTVFMKLSVFRGGFTRDAAQEVAGANLRVLMSLAKKSLIRRNANTGRYVIHELLRQYAEIKLTDNSLTDDVYNAHLRYFAQFMANRTLDIKGRRQIDCFEEIDNDFDNILKAWQRAEANGEPKPLLEMIETLALYCEMMAMKQTIAPIVESTLHHFNLFNNDVSELNRLRVFYLYIMSYENRMFAPHLSELLEKSMSIAVSQNNKFEQMLCYYMLGTPHHNEYAKVTKPNLEAAIDIATNLDDLFYVGRSLRELHIISLWNFQSEAEEIRKQHYKIIEQISDVHGFGHVKYYEYVRDWLSGDLQSAKHNIHETLSFCQVSRDIKSIGVGQFSAGVVYMDLADFDNAEHYLKLGLDAQSKINFEVSHSYMYAVLGEIELLRGNLDEAIRYSKLGLNYLLSETSWKFYVYECLAMVALTVQDDGQTKNHLWNALQYSIDWIPTRHILSGVCLSAFIYHNQQQSDRAVELLSLTLNHTAKLVAWWDEWELFQQLQSDLKTQLSDETYNNAWERGKSLDLETVVQELLIEFSEAN